MATRMRWREAVLASLHAYCQRRHTRIVQRQSLIAEEMEAITSATKSRGATPAYTLSKILQELRDEGVLEFLRTGEYLLLDVSIKVEDEELPDDAIDHALRANRLLFDNVPTDMRPAIVRQRRGQARVRQLTVNHYKSCCAVCDIEDQRLLVASHIVGWAEAPEHRGDLSNVICLCRIHDALFEAGFWSLEDSLMLLKREPVASKMVRLLLAELTSFRLPLKYPPAPRFVSRHRERAGFRAHG